MPTFATDEEVKPGATSKPSSAPTNGESLIPGILQHKDKGPWWQPGDRERTEKMYGKERVAEVYDEETINDQLATDKVRDPQTEKILNSHPDEIAKGFAAAKLENIGVTISKRVPQSELQTVEIPLGDKEKFHVSRIVSRGPNGALQSEYQVRYQEDFGSPLLRLDPASDVAKISIRQAKERIFDPADAQRIGKEKFIGALLSDNSKLANATWKSSEHNGKSVLQADIDGYHVELAKGERQIGGQNLDAARVICSKWAEASNLKSKSLFAERLSEPGKENDPVASAYELVSSVLSGKVQPKDVKSPEPKAEPKKPEDEKAPSRQGLLPGKSIGTEVKTSRGAEVDGMTEWTASFKFNEDLAASGSKTLRVLAYDAERKKYSQVASHTFGEEDIHSFDIKFKAGDAHAFDNAYAHAVTCSDGTLEIRLDPFSKSSPAGIEEATDSKATAKRVVGARLQVTTPEKSEDGKYRLKMEATCLGAEIAPKMNTELRFAIYDHVKGEFVECAKTFAEKGVSQNNLGCTVAVNEPLKNPFAYLVEYADGSLELRVDSLDRGK